MNGSSDAPSGACGAARRRGASTEIPMTAPLVPGVCPCGRPGSDDGFCDEHAGAIAFKVPVGPNGEVLPAVWWHWPHAKPCPEGESWIITLPHGALIVLTADGQSELTTLREMEGSKVRDRYLAGAADALLVFNPGNIREAFDYDPAISYLKKAHRTDWLLTTPVVERMYSNFQQLRAALAYDARDLSVPLVSWLKYLLQTGRSIPS